jgi:hypothetical protein
MSIQKPKHIAEITEVRDVQIGEDIYTRISTEEFRTVEYLDNGGGNGGDSLESCDVKGLVQCVTETVSSRASFFVFAGR